MKKIEVSRVYNIETITANWGVIANHGDWVETQSGDFFRVGENRYRGLPLPV